MEIPDIIIKLESILKSNGNIIIADCGSNLDIYSLIVSCVLSKDEILSENRIALITVNNNEKNKLLAVSKMSLSNEEIIMYEFINTAFRLGVVEIYAIDTVAFLENI